MPPPPMVFISFYGHFGYYIYHQDDKLNFHLTLCACIKEFNILIKKLLINTFLFKVFDNYAVTVMIGGEPYTLGLFDTAGKKIMLNIKNTISTFIYSKLLCLFDKY